MQSQYIASHAEGDDSHLDLEIEQIVQHPNDPSNIPQTTIEADADLDATQLFESGEFVASTQAKKKPPFPGDFINNLNGQSAVKKIQQELFRETYDVLATTNHRNDWFDRKINNEWFGSHGIFQE